MKKVYHFDGRLFLLKKIVKPSFPIFVYWKVENPVILLFEL